MVDVTIELDEPNSPQQLAAYESDALNKLLRAGRRAGKTVVDLLMAVAGHGPVVEGRRKFPGLASGLGDVFWILPTRTARNSIWNDAVKRQFPKEWLNETDLILTLPTNGCRLWVISAEAIGSVRGSGSRVLGCIVDEAGWLALRTSLQRVLLPVLMDNEAWLVLSSTTNAGQDGDRDENDQMASPSFFNTLCEEESAGLRPDWAQFHWTARDNPSITEAALQRLISEYPIGSVELDQEVWAKLLIAGGRVAFPELDETVHIQRWSPEKQKSKYVWTCGGDWGYSSHGCFGLMATSLQTGRTMVRQEMYFRELTPYAAGQAWGRVLQSFGVVPEFMICDEPAMSDGGSTINARIGAGIRDILTEPVILTTPPKGPGSRETKKLEVHAVLRYDRAKDGTVPAWSQPLLVFHPDCTNLIRTLWRLPRDPRGKPDVDTKADDHCYDMMADWLMATRGPDSEAWRDRVAKASKSLQHADNHAGRQTLLTTPDSEIEPLSFSFDTQPDSEGWKGAF